jgi:alpha-L-rhamnosidase
MRSIVLLLPLIAAAVLPAQTSAPPDPQHREWTAGWITHPTAPLRDPLVLHFRRSLDINPVPASYVVRVSADNRFILFVNGHRVGEGPARGDLGHWRYERFDLAPLLKPGENVITATVWNWGVYAPVAQMSDRTAFLLESEATGSISISTPEGWRVEEERGRWPLERKFVTIQTYMAAGPGEEVDGSKYDWNAHSATGTTALWVPGASPMRDSIFPDVNKAHSADTTGDNFWGLVPDELPPMEYARTSAGTVVRADTPDLRDFPGGPVTIGAGKHVHLLLDRKTLTTAYPRLMVSGGKGSHIRLTYSEALYDKEQHKGDRDDVGERVALGLNDSFLADGGPHRYFEPLWWRTWRYLDLDIETGSDPVTLESLTASFTAYPFEERAKLQSGDADLDKIWEISWRTARLDAHETYMDTPYYEQLQYIGDTRIQALISYTVGGDDRLARQALEAFNVSRIPEGITRSRYPSSLPQNIPTFSLLWIGMLHDWWMYRPDPTPVRESIEGTRAVLNWFSQYEQPDSLLRKVPWWPFIDWVNKGEIPTYDVNGESCVVTLQYLGALDDAADLEKNFGNEAIAADYRQRAEHTRAGIRDKCWSDARGLVSDSPDKKVFSQQANVLAVLFDVTPKDRQQEVLRKMLDIEPGTTPDGILSASYYFRFYLARALDHAGMADDYLKSLDPWRKLLPLHFSTWPETPEPTRSDSHAWTAHPIYDLLTLVAGIEPASPGFATVRIAPHLGTLPSLSAVYPHPDGMIEVKYQRRGTGIDATITLPGKLEGEFLFQGKTRKLTPGVNQITVD